MFFVFIDCFVGMFVFVVVNSGIMAVVLPQFIHFIVVKRRVVGIFILCGDDLAISPKPSARREKFKNTVETDYLRISVAAEFLLPAAFSISFFIVVASSIYFNSCTSSIIIFVSVSTMSKIASNSWS